MTLSGAADVVDKSVDCVVVLESRSPVCVIAVAVVSVVSEPVNVCSECGFVKVLMGCVRVQDEDERSEETADSGHVVNMLVDAASVMVVSESA